MPFGRCALTYIRRVRLWLVVVLCGIILISAGHASETKNSLDELRFLARQFEKEGDWSRACSFYSYLLSKHPGLSDVKERLQTCLRNFHRVRRHGDSSFREGVLQQDIASALKIYGEVLSQLQAEYWDASKVDWSSLFHQGVEELVLALNDESFRRAHIPHATVDDVDGFLSLLRKDHATARVRFQLEAQNQALQIALLAKRVLGLRPTVAVLEMTCGACNSLDEYSYYLSPQYFLEEMAPLKGDLVGVGLDLRNDQQRIIVAQVAVGSPAGRAGINRQDQITRIDKTATHGLSSDRVMDRLKGKVGSAVEIEVVSPANEARTVVLVRQPEFLSISFSQIVDPEAGIGFIKLTTFHENTMRELNEAIRQLQMQGMQSLVLDLRDNPGGLLNVAVAVAERFLDQGAAIAGSRGRAEETKMISRNLRPLDIPLVVLVDETTASAAEVVASALKENGRATIVGQPTYGKNSMQQLVEMKSVQAGGFRFTWAKLQTPANRGGNGSVVPHLLVARSVSQAFDEQFQAALTVLANRMD